MIRKRLLIQYGLDHMSPRKLLATFATPNLKFNQNEKYIFVYIALIFSDE